MDIINVAGLKSHLSEVLTQVSTTGQTVIVGKYGVPIAQISPYVATPAPIRSIGFAKHLQMTQQENLQQQADAPTDEALLNSFYT